LSFSLPPPSFSYYFQFFATRKNWRTYSNIKIVPIWYQIWS
jgi:hypothetical protein